MAEGRNVEENDTDLRRMSPLHAACTVQIAEPTRRWNFLPAYRTTGRPVTRQLTAHTHVRTELYVSVISIHTQTDRGTPSIITIILTNNHEIIMELLKDYVLRKQTWEGNGGLSLACYYYCFLLCSEEAGTRDLSPSCYYYCCCYSLLRCPSEAGIKKLQAM